MNKRQITLCTNSLIFTTFLILAGTGLGFRFINPQLQVERTWVSLHNWVGLLMLAGIAIHLVLHWQWIKAVAARFLKKTSRQARINFCVDCLMFWVFILICLSGLIEWISASGEGLFYIMHRNTGTALVIYVVLHLSLHWKWITNTLNTGYKQVFRRWSHQPGTS